MHSRWGVNENRLNTLHPRRVAFRNYPSLSPGHLERNKQRHAKLRKYEHALTSVHFFSSAPWFLWAVKLNLLHNVQYGNQRMILDKQFKREYLAVPKNGGAGILISHKSTDW
ncbi:hypothetical protein F443_05667 [Phytophthora nicotianae P1569]|uniref:Uncharacterized protein n=1 Tax=Phytophthora nicotianae P1569 TaxID=1317065 RepID=V9FHA5_PHYNI|nr:hypothetical protein F443_05667 [Phytophthora nicotianae P1569]